jgi:hypothetical protein
VAYPDAVLAVKSKEREVPFYPLIDEALLNSLGLLLETFDGVLASIEGLAIAFEFVNSLIGVRDRVTCSASTMRRMRGMWFFFAVVERRALNTTSPIYLVGLLRNLDRRDFLCKADPTANVRPAQT